jgi:uroporphyrinogen-III decarboxylase
VEKSEDWPYGDYIPFIDDYLIPRSKKFLITPEDNLEALRYLLAPPLDEDIGTFRAHAQHVKKLAAERDLLTVGTYGTVGDMVAWLCGIYEMILYTYDNPCFVHQILKIIEEWNRQRVALLLEQGVDLIIRRAWYENADAWSPTLYKRFLYPSLKRDVEMAHQAGSKFGILMSYASLPLVDMMIDAGVDVLMGVDPAQDRTMNLHKLKLKVTGKMCIWGGVCGYLTIERGTADDIKREVREAISTLAPGGGFILAPVTNVRANTQRVWRNIEVMIDEWHSLRSYPIVI